MKTKRGVFQTEDKRESFTGNESAVTFDVEIFQDFSLIALEIVF